MEITAEELKKIINEEIQNALTKKRNNKREGLAELERQFRDAIDGINMNWYSAWNAIRTVEALKMGYACMTKIPEEKFDVYLTAVKTSTSEIIRIMKGENK